MEIKNAVIESVSLSNDDHGCLSAWLHLNYGGSGQGFGGHALYLPKSFKHHGGPNYAGHFIFRCLEIAGVGEWSRLPGKTVRAKADHGKVYSIGHIIEDDWFEPDSDFEEMAEAYEKKTDSKSCGGGDAR